MRRSFRRGHGDNAGMLRVNDEVRSLITFRQLNLMHEWPMKGPFDVIFCRNVVIYFEKSTQRLLFNRYADLLADGGHLFIGHSETLFKVCDRFTLIGRTIYRKN
jgi:chemotaxis protein methyltransferase CheR